MATRASTRTPGQLFALVFGVVYLLIGIAGFFVESDFTTENGAKLLVFPVNGLHNVVHIAVGLLWIGGSSSASTAKSVNTLIGVVYLLTALLGFLGMLKFLSIAKGFGGADNWLHLVSGALALYFGTAGAGVRSRA